MKNMFSRLAIVAAMATMTCFAFADGDGTPKMVAAPAQPQAPIHRQMTATGAPSAAAWATVTIEGAKQDCFGDSCKRDFLNELQKVKADLIAHMDDNQRELMAYMRQEFDAMRRDNAAGFDRVNTTMMTLWQKGCGGEGGKVTVQRGGPSDLAFIIGSLGNAAAQYFGMRDGATRINVNNQVCATGGSVTNSGNSTNTNQNCNTANATATNTNQICNSLTATLEAIQKTRGQGGH